MKNTSKYENLLTTSSLTITRKSIYLGMSALLLLTGCEMPSLSDLSGDSRPAQRVDGARRAPTYNNRSMSAPAPAPSQAEANAKLPPMVTNVSPQKTEASLSSPYDQYDSNGNEVEIPDPSTETAQAENKPEDKKGFFSGWFGFDDETPKPVPEPKEYVEQKFVEPTIVRKSFLGNPYKPRAAAPLMEVSPQSKIETKESKITFVDNAVPEKTSITVVEKGTAPEPVNNPAIITSEPDVTNNNVNIASNMEPVSIASTTEPAREYNSMPNVDAAPQPASENETLLGRIGSKLDVFELSEREPEKTQQAPEISSVPARPDAFDAVKSEQQQNLNELKQDHSISKQEKELLEREAPAPSVPATSNQSPSSLVPQLVTEPVTAEKKLKEPVAPLVAATPDVKPVMEQTPPPEPFLASEKSNVEEDAKPVIVETLEEEKPNFFERLFTKAPESKPAEEIVFEKIEDPAPVASISSLSEVNIEASPDKKEETHEEAKIIDDLAANAVATAQSSPPPVDSSFEPLDTAAAVSLPSPDIIKTMRPSRYDARRSQASGY